MSPAISIPSARLEVCEHSCRLKGRRPEAGGRAGEQEAAQGARPPGPGRARL